MGKSIGDLILDYFKSHPYMDLPHGPVVDYVEDQYVKLYGKKPRDTWRQIRKFHQDGTLIKVSKGIYRYEPENVKKRVLYDFSPEVKEAIFKRDGYKCVICGRGREHGVEICADHKVAKDKGGDNSIENGETLCTEHNLLKKNYSMRECGKLFYIRLYESAMKNNDQRMIKFCIDVFDVYDKYQVDTHIDRPDKK